MISTQFTLFTLFALLAVPATAQKSAITVDSVVDAYVRAVGGESAIAKLSTRVRKGTTEIVGVPGKGQVEEYYKAPNKMMLKLTLPVIGTIQYGYDGTSGWRRDPTSGLVDVRGKELSELAFQSVFNSEVKPRERYSKLELKGIEKVGGRDAYLVMGTPSGLPPERLYFDTQSGLLVRLDVTRATEAGEVSDEVYLEDYREVDGVKTPFVEQHRSFGLTYFVRIASVKNNVPIENAIFSKPGQK